MKGRWPWIKEALGWGIALLLLLLALGPSWGAEKNYPYHFVAFGDMPYRLPEDNGLITGLIDRINASQPAFVVNVGDIKNGGSRCSEASYRHMADILKTLDAPVLYTPGDNEWTDCQRLMCGGYNPFERLDVLRRVFYTDLAPFEKTLSVTHQNATTGFEPYVENARWSVGPVDYATLHVVGSNNSLLQEKGRFAEYQARNKANLYWLKETFALAQAHQARGVVLFIHADPFLPLPQKGLPSGFVDFLKALKQEAQTHQLEVLLVHGDSHLYRVDLPFEDASTHTVVPNITRTVVFGSPDIHGVRVDVTPDGPHLFSIHPFF